MAALSRALEVVIGHAEYKMVKIIQRKRGGMAAWWIVAWFDSLPDCGPFYGAYSLVSSIIPKTCMFSWIGDCKLPFCVSMRVNGVFEVSIERKVETKMPKRH